MSLSVQDLISKARRLINDYPQGDSLTANMTNSVTTATVADSTLYRNGMIISINEEAMLVKAAPTGTTVTVVRGWKGTTPTTHTSGDGILLDPLGTGADYLDGLNEGMRYLWPHFYQSVVDTSIVVENLVSDYALPTTFPSGASRIMRMMVLYPGAPEISWYGYREFEVVRGDDVAGGDVVRFTNTPPFAGSKVKLIGIARPDADLVLGSSLPTTLPDYAFYCLPTYAAYYVLVSAEGKRDKVTRAQNVGPAAVTPQANAQLAFSLLQKFQSMKAEQAMAWPVYTTRRRF